MTDNPTTEPERCHECGVAYGYHNSECKVKVYEDGCLDTWLDAAQALDMKPSEIRLHAGEMTAGEMRAVLAVLTWKAREFRSKAGGSE